MRKMALTKVFTLLEPGPVVLVTTCDAGRNNIMTISWTMVMDFTPRFAITTGEWNYSYRALEKTRECVIAIPTVDMLDTVVGIGTCSGGHRQVRALRADVRASPGGWRTAHRGVHRQHRVQGGRYRRTAQHRGAGCRGGLAG